MRLLDRPLRPTMAVMMGLALACGESDGPSDGPAADAPLDGTSAAPAESEPEHRLQALVATSGEGADSLMAPGGRWSPVGNAIDEGLLLRLERPLRLTDLSVTGCGTESRWRVYVNGAQRSQRLDVSGTVTYDLVAGEATPVRSIFLKSLGAEACLREIVPHVEAGPLDMGAPRRIGGSVSASSILAPAPAYDAVYLFDQRADFGWVEGVDGLGVGESIEVALDGPVELHALELWNGYQRSADHFAKNARASALRVSMDGGAAIELAVSDEQGAQRLELASPLTGEVLRIEIAGATPGTRYEDLVLSELRLWDATGPIAVTPSNAEARRAALEAQTRDSALAGVLDQAFEGVCDFDGRRTLKLRGDHSFVRYENQEMDDTQVIFDGTWVMTDAGAPWSDIRFYGRRHTSTVDWNPYGGDQVRDSIKIAGGKVRIARVADLSPGAWADVVGGEKAIEAVHGCLDAGGQAELGARGAIVVEGAAVTDVMVPNRG